MSFASQPHLAAPPWLGIKDPFRESGRGNGGGSGDWGPWLSGSIKVVNTSRVSIVLEEQSTPKLTK